MGRPLTPVVAIRSSEKAQLGRSENDNDVRPASVGVAGWCRALASATTLVVRLRTDAEDSIAVPFHRHAQTPLEDPAHA